MKKFIFALLLIASYPCFGQDRIEMSFSQLFQKIEQSKDSVFKLTHAKINFDSLTDQRFTNFREPKDSIWINTSIVLEDVIIDGGIFHYISFKKPVKLIESGPFRIRNSSFSQEFKLRNSEKFDLFKNDTIGYLWYDISNNLFLSPVEVQIFGNNPNSVTANSYQLNFEYNVITTDKRKTDFNNSIVDISGYDLVQVSINKNKIEAINGFVYFNATGPTNNALITSNTIRSEALFIHKRDGVREFELWDNKIEATVLWDVDQLNQSYIIDWKDLNTKLISGTKYFVFHYNYYSDTIFQSNIYSAEFVDNYRNTHRIENEYAFNAESSLLGSLRNHYLENHNRAFANSVFIAFKDLETQRLAYLYREDPSFKTFFTWKVNQFLKIFSAYGTEPAKAIIFSMYVILAFALVYLFFPNHWDSHGKHRIMDRYRFFLKYVNRDSGIHEVYLEEQKHELLNAEDFKVYLQEQGKTAPKFFMATAIPLYKWSVAGTNTFSWFLEKIDFLKGKWSETEPSKQSGKSVLLITAFLIALTYDILIKMLNALMLSINTFTTLGFGEIPIKGLPRYLAIIQGFIGWFMLTIFSVSLISQLLN